MVKTLSMYKIPHFFNPSHMKGEREFSIVASELLLYYFDSTSI